MGVRGEMVLIRYDRETGREIGRSRGPNVFLANGLAAIAARLAVTTGSPARGGSNWSATNMFLQINTSSGSGGVVGNSTTDVAVTSVVTGQSLRVTWIDRRGTAYTLHRTNGLQPRIGSSGSSLARHAQNPWPSVGWNGGSKPANEDWSYQWTVTISGSAAAPSTGASVTWDSNAGRNMAQVLRGDMAPLKMIIESTDDSSGSISYETELDPGHDRDAVDAETDTASGATVSFKRHRDGDAPYTLQGERLSLADSAAGRLCTISGTHANGSVVRNQALNFTHSITFAAA